MGAMFRVLSTVKLGLTSRAVSMLSGFDAIQVPERWKGVHVVSPRLIRCAHDAGIEVHVWTVNDPDDMHRLFDLGVDGIVTDRSDLAMDVIRSRT
jgi:glycerophosphoryl diester phosphodiesterase